jgi:nucleotide-binding universal stress UspA family protein
MTDTSRPQMIVVGIDGLAPSVDAFRWAVRQAQVTGSAVEALMAWQYPAGVVPAGTQDFEAESRRALDGAIEGAFSGAPPVQVTRVVEEGEPALTLVERSTDAALLVIGSRGHGAFMGTLIGSVSQYCVAHAHCPVVVLRGPAG